MSKDRDWVDYANLASNVTRSVQLADLQATLVKSGGSCKNELGRKALSDASLYRPSDWLARFCAAERGVHMPACSDGPWLTHGVHRQSPPSAPSSGTTQSDLTR